MFGIRPIFPIFLACIFGCLSITFFECYAETALPTNILLQTEEQKKTALEKEIKVSTEQPIPIKKSEITAPERPQSEAVLQALQNEPATPQKMLPAPVGEEDPADIYLNFEGATLTSVVNYLVEQRKLNILPKSDLDAIKVSLSTRQGITLKKAWDILLSLLAMNGFTMINVDNLYRIIPVTAHTAEPLPIYSSAAGILPEDLPDNDLVIRYIMFLKNIKAGTAKGILDAMLNGDKAVLINEALDALIITERCLNIKAAMKIVMALEQDGLRESISIITLQYASPEVIAKLFNEEILDNKDKGPAENIRLLTAGNNKSSSFFSKRVKVMPYSRKASLILMGQESDVQKIRNFIYTYLDVPNDAAERRLHTKEILYHDAGDIKKLLDGIVGPLPGIDPKVLAPGGYKVFEDIQIAAESPKNGENGNYGSGNRLIISCGKDDWRRLEKIIDRLDKAEPQVALEVMIVDVNADTVNDLSAQMRLHRPGMLGKDIGFQAANISSVVTNPAFPSSGTAPFPVTLSASSLDPSVLKSADLTGLEGAAGSTGNTSVTLGKDGDAWGFIRTIINSKKSNIISQPFLVTNNGQPCDITSNDNRLYDGKLDPSSTSVVQKREPQTATTTIKITPRINGDGIVDLSISIEAGDFTGVEAGNATKRTMNTRVQMGVGEVLVLGGLTSSKVIEFTSGTPILDKIPLIRNLFSGKSRTKSNANLYLFLRVSIVKPQLEGRPDDYTQLKLDYAKRQILHVDSYTKTKDPIQRWFFKPSHHSISETIKNMKNGNFAPIDDFAENKKIPPGSDIANDPFYRPVDTIKEEQAKRKRPTSKKNENSVNLLPELSLKRRKPNTD